MAVRGFHVQRVAGGQPDEIHASSSERRTRFMRRPRRITCGPNHPPARSRCSSRVEHPSTVATSGRVTSTETGVVVFSSFISSPNRLPSLRQHGCGRCAFPISAPLARSRGRKSYAIAIAPTHQERTQPPARSRALVPLSELKGVKHSSQSIRSRNLQYLRTCSAQVLDDSLDQLFLTHHITSK